MGVCLWRENTLLKFVHLHVSMIIKLKQQSCKNYHVGCGNALGITAARQFNSAMSASVMVAATIRCFVRSQTEESSRIPVAAVFLCWVPAGVSDTFKKEAYVFWRTNPHTQHFLWRRIILGYPFSSRLVDGLFRIPFLACDDLPLLVFKKSHSDLQLHYRHPHIFHSHNCLSLLMTFAQPSISDVFHETLPIPWQRQQIRWRRHFLYTDPPSDIHFWIVVPWHHLVHNTRSVTNFTGHLVYRFPGGSQTVELG